MARSYLCSQHQAQAAKGTPEKLISTIQKCCGQGPDFLAPRMPVLETIFRLLLAGGNQPTTSEDLADRLSQLRGEHLYPETVEQLLGPEPRFYGIRRQAEEEAEAEAGVEAEVEGEAEEEAKVEEG